LASCIVVHRVDPNVALWEQIRSGTVPRRKLSEVERLQLMRAIDQKKIEKFGVRQLHCIELNERLPPVAGAGVSWMDEMTMLDYASWRGRDHTAAALVRGGADPHPVPTGACRAALEALPQEGLAWLLRAVIRMVSQIHEDSKCLLLARTSVCVEIRPCLT